MIDDMVDFIFTKMLLPAFAIILALIVFVVIPIGIYGCIQDSKRPTFDLKKDDWICSRSRVEISTNYFMVGKVMVPQTSHSTVCDQWSHK